MSEIQRGVWLFGKGRLAVYTAKLVQSLPKYDLKGLIPVEKEPEWDISFKNWGEENSLPILTLESWRLTQLSRGDLGISIYFDKLFSASDLKRIALFLNLHNSPLPKYRGMRPINWALENEEMTHGVTLHKIENGIDTGPILGQITFPIFCNQQEVSDVYNTCVEIAKVLIRDTLTFSEFSEFHEQDESKATYYSNLDISKLRKHINWGSRQWL